MTGRLAPVAPSTREFFESLPARVDAAKIAGERLSYVFDIDGAGAWTVTVAGGAVTVEEGVGEAACTISASEPTFQKIVAGEQNPTKAYMTGKIKVRGDMGAAMKLQKLFPRG